MVVINRHNFIAYLSKIVIYSNYLFLRSLESTWNRAFAVQISSIWEILIIYFFKINLIIDGQL